MSGLDNAAAAFQQDMNGGNAPNDDTNTGAVERMFGNIGDLEVDEDSPPVGGGDNLPVKGEKKARRAKAEPEDDEDDPLYGLDEQQSSEDPDDAEDEDEDDDEDEDEDDEPSDEELSEEELEAIAERKVTITVDGEEQTVPLNEALDGYIRLQTFHKRLNEVNEAQNLVDEAASEVATTRQQVIDSLTEVQEMMEAVLPPEPDWDAAFANDPAKARSLQKSYAAMKAKIDDVKQRRNAQIEAARKENIAQLKKYKDLESRKFEGRQPNWVGEEGQRRKQKDMEAMVRTARAIGFTDAEILQVMDSRMLEVLLRASKFDRMMAARKTKALPKRGKTLKNPGAGSVRTAPRGIDRAQKRLAQTGSVEAAAEVFSNMINRG